jgi:hypothetical protein
MELMFSIRFAGFLIPLALKEVKNSPTVREISINKADSKKALADKPSQAKPVKLLNNRNNYGH